MLQMGIDVKNITVYIIMSSAKAASLTFVLHMVFFLQTFVVNGGEKYPQNQQRIS